PEPEAEPREPDRREPGAAADRGARAHPEHDRHQRESHRGQHLDVHPRGPGGSAVGALARRGQPGAADHADDHAADHGQQPQPLPMALTPRTSWKYSGIAKKMPNIANETSVAKMVPQVNPADR